MADNKPLIIDSADKVPPIPARPPHAMISGADWRTPPRARLDWPWHVSVMLGLALLLLTGFLIYRLDQAVRAWGESGPVAAWLTSFTPPALVGVGLVIVVYRLAGWAYYATLRQRGEAYERAIGRTRLGVPIAYDVAASMSASEVYSAEQSAIALELGRAPYTKYPLLSTLSEGNKESAETTIYGAPSEESSGPAGVPSSDWLRWIDETPHLMIAGRTNAGKTTLASAILAERIQAGDEVLVIDPHDQPDKWFGLSAVGGGRRYDDILAVLDRVVREMDARYQAYNEGTPTATFRRLTVLVDEVPAIMDACLNEHRRIIDGRWSQFARKLGSEARKVRISVILLAQSVLVQDIGINTAMRKNFSRIALGDETRRLLGEERSSERRKLLEDLIRGQRHPAVMDYQSEIHVLNTADVVELAQQDVARLVRAWRPSVRTVPDPPQNGHFGRTDGGRTYTQDRIKDYLRAHARKGHSREFARKWAQSYGLQFENQLWTEVLGEVKQ